LYEFVAFRQSNKVQISTLGKIIAANSTAALAFQDHDDAYETLNSLRAEKHVVAACLYDDSGHIFAVYPLYLKESDFPASPGKPGYNYVNSFLVGFEPVLLEQKFRGTLYLKSDMKAMYERFTLYSFIALLVIAVSSLLAFLLSNRLQKIISDPILALAATAGIISRENDYTVRAEKKADDELGLLTDAFNQMLTQIETQNAEITGLNHALERKVVDRTIKLEQANNELKLQNEFVEKILDASVHHIAVLDTEMRFTSINKMTEQIYGIKRDEVFGKSYIEVFPQSKDSRAHNDIQRALNGKYVHNPVTKSAIINGYFENYFIPLKQDSKVYAVLILSHDITQIMEANEKLMRVNVELEKSNNDLEQFAYVASHDLQEPLRKIQVFSNYAEQNIDNKEDTKKYLLKIKFSAERMSDLIRAVLNYSRLSHLEEQFGQVNLNQVIENIKIDLELVIAEKEAVINTGKLPVITGIKLQINQLFLNLISNSLKFSNNQPVINISSGILTANDVKQYPELEPEKRYVEIILTDNGIGFEQEYAGKIFNVFQRLHNRSQFPGTGIGLALCKKIIDNHHGSISATGELGKGASFSIVLPL